MAETYAEIYRRLVDAHGKALVDKGINVASHSLTQLKHTGLKNAILRLPSHEFAECVHSLLVEAFTLTKMNVNVTTEGDSVYVSIL